ncbi:MAG: UBP-type zinc finger domain-containing protein [Burkholderiaceae bacterium]
MCRHLDQIVVTTTGTRVCVDCVKLGDNWVHLRLCMSCGHVGCCDSSKNRHASRHFLRTGHPLVRSIEPGERWIWCYADSVMPGELAD